MQFFRLTPTVWLMCFAALGMFSPVQADTQPLTYNRINFSVSEQQIFPNDQLNVTLYAQFEDVQSAKVAEYINQNMAQAVSQAKQFPTVKVKTGNYTIHPIYARQKHEQNKIIRWSGKQSLLLTSTDVAALTRLMQQLQTRLHVSGTHFSISDKARFAAEAQMVQTALQQFKQRAQEVVDTVGAKSYKIVQLNINTPRRPGPSFQRNRMEMAAAAPMSAPALSGGEGKLQVQVNSEIELQF